MEKVGSMNVGEIGVMGPCGPGESQMCTFGPTKLMSKNLHLEFCSECSRQPGEMQELRNQVTLKMQDENVRLPEKNKVRIM